MDRFGIFVLYLMQCGAESGEKFEKFEISGGKTEFLKFLLVLRSTCSCLGAQLLITHQWALLLIQLLS